MAILRGKLAELTDLGMDLAVVPGFSAIGFRARKRMFSWQPVWLEGRVGDGHRRQFGSRQGGRARPRQERGGGPHGLPEPREGRSGP